MRGVNYLDKINITKENIEAQLESKNVFNIKAEYITNFNVVHNDLVFEVDP